MPETRLQPVSDKDFAHQVGIVADLTPRLSRARKVLLAVALLLAGSTTVFAGLFQAGNATGSGNFQTGVTQCPMMGPPNNPAR